MKTPSKSASGRTGKLVQILKSHLMSHTRLHNIWCAMRERCRTKGCSGYKKYGAKGITVCDEWESFESFRDWAYENGYDDTLTIDRINCHGNYEPSNCRWVTQKVQQNNRSNNIHITCNGETHSPKEWAEITGIPLSNIYDRYFKGWSHERIINQPKRKSPTKRVQR